MSKHSKKILIVASIAALNLNAVSAIPFSNGMYDMRPKNHFRGGSIGKGGKIKYRRT